MGPTILQPQGLTAASHSGQFVFGQTDPVSGGPQAAPTHTSPAPQVPGIPESFQVPGCQAVASPFDEDAGPQTPNVRPTGPYGYQQTQHAQGMNLNIYDRV